MWASSFPQQISSVHQSHGLELLDGGLLVGIAKINIGGGACGLQVFLSKFLQCIKVTASFVVLHVVRVSVLDSREPTDSVRITQWFSISGAVDVGNESACVSFEFAHKFVPCWLHRFAVSSPRRQKLDEHSLAGYGIVPICWGKLSGSCNS